MLELMAYVGFALLCFAFIIWSVALRNIARFLIKDCLRKSDKFHLLSPIDFSSTIWWIYAIGQNILISYFPAHFLFVSALWITVYTDLQHMLISRFVSIYLVPVGIFCAYMELLPITPLESLLAAVFGYGFFWLANTLFCKIKGHDGLGQGDLELMAMIGSFTGALGCWFTILCSSLMGTTLGCLYMLWSKKPITIMPFGPLLALGASIFVLHRPEIMTWLILHS